jgi:hypothetical protein
LRRTNFKALPRPDDESGTGRERRNAVRAQPTTRRSDRPINRHVPYRASMMVLVH